MSFVNDIDDTIRELISLKKTIKCFDDKTNLFFDSCNARGVTEDQVRIVFDELGLND